MGVKVLVGHRPRVVGTTVSRHERLLTHFREHPEDRTVLSGHKHSDQNHSPWITALVANGLRIGMIDPQSNADFITTVTASTFAALDTWALAHPGEPENVTTHTLTLFLSRLWNTPDLIRSPAPKGGRPVLGTHKK